MLPAIGEVFTVPYPFVRDVYNQVDSDEDGVTFTDVPTWKPGVRFEDVGEGWVDSIADGMGAMRLTVVSVHKPGRYPTRVFFTRQWVDPDGKVFGKGKLHIASLEKFRRLSRGYQHEIDVKPAEAVSA